PAGCLPKARAAVLAAAGQQVAAWRKRQRIDPPAVGVRLASLPAVVRAVPQVDDAAVTAERQEPAVRGKRQAADTDGRGLLEPARVAGPWLAPGEVPQDGAAVGVGRGELPVGGEADRPDAVVRGCALLVSREAVKLLSGGHVPQAHRRVVAAGGESF